MRSRSQRPTFTVQLRAAEQAPSAEAYDVVVDKHKIEASVQMLHENESCVLAATTNASIEILNTANNDFSVIFSRLVQGEMQAVYEGYVSSDVIKWRALGRQNTTSTPHRSVLSMLCYTKRQIVPIYSTAADVAQNFQGEYGSIPLAATGKHRLSVNNAFLRNNACTVSKLTDILNNNVTGGRGSHHFAARLVWLAAIFASTAPSTGKCSFFTVSQMQMTDVPEEVYTQIQQKAPEKQHVTVLMRGDNKNDRIKRFNVAVRIFTENSDFVKQVLPTVIGMNDKIYSSVMVVSGVRNRQLAAIFLSSQSLNFEAHSAAMQTFLVGLRAVQ